MTKPLFLGIDVGTQSVRVGLFDTQGKNHGLAVEPITTTYPQPGWAEQNASEIWSITGTAMRSLLGSANVSVDDIAGIGLDFTACTVIACNDAGQPLHPILLWMDQRSFREAEEISASNHPILRFVSGAVSPEWMLPKALWLKRNRPEVFAQATKIIEITDWFMFQLTGTWNLSLNNIAVKWNYASPDGGWPSDFLATVQLPEIREKWPADIVPLGEGNGKLSATAANHLGLRPGIPVAQGGIDAYLGMLGMGATNPGDMAMIIGSSTCHLAMSEKELLGSGMLGCYPDAVLPNTYTLEGGQTSTGSILNWYREHFAGNEAQEAAKSGENVYAVLDRKAGQIPPGCDGLQCLDYWQGNRCPHKDPRARGVFWGLSLSHGPGHVFRSIYEATAMGTRAIVEDVAGHGLAIERFFAGGGGARSTLWMQIHADILNKPIHLPQESEACLLGSAMVAAVHTGHHSNFSEAAKEMVRMASVVEPNPANVKEYQELYHYYVESYQAMKLLFHQKS